MYKTKKVICIVPARLHSTRFPKKILQKLKDKSLLQWVFEAASRCEIFDDIIFAVDASEVFEHVRSFGGRAMMTGPHHINGTSRLIEVISDPKITADIVVNWQADEPFIKRSLILDLLQSIDQEGQIWTLKRKIKQVELLEDPNIVKVVCNSKDEAMYFSRSLIPFDIQNPQSARYKHIGIYAFTFKTLKEIRDLKEAPCEIQESLEQLRFLYHGFKIKVHTTKYETFGIDTKKHLDLALLKLEKESNRQDALPV